MTPVPSWPIRWCPRCANTSATRCCERSCLGPCACPRPRPRANRSPSTIRCRAARSPIAMSPGRCTMARRSGLGRGLSSLIPEAEGASAEAGVGDLTMIPVDQVVPNPNQPRLHFDEAALADLADSIAQIGVLQPVLVRRVDDAFQLIAGERRWRAARRAGLTEIPAIVRDSDDVAAVEEALVENLHRADLTALEEAAAYLQLIEDFQLTHDDVAKRVGKSRSAVTNTLRLMGLPPEVQRLLADGNPSAGHARALLGTADRALQEQLADKVVG